MLTITLFAVLVSSAVSQQTMFDIPAEYYVLNLHHDHCRSPMAFSMDSLQCECPPPLERVGNTCECVDCFRQTTQQRYTENEMYDLPDFINEVLEPLE